MTRDMNSNDQSEIPTRPLTVPGADVPPQDEPLTDSRIGAALGAGRSKPSPGAWEPPTPEALQRDFPQHEIRGILGRGGMGAVYKGWQRSLDRFVAIKILPPGLDDGISDFTERFKREAKAMAHLKHPGIVAVHDAGTTASGLLYFVMECVEGTDVQQLMRDGQRLDPGEALRITSAACDALAYAHAHGVIHRDIKPSNIMLDEGGTVKVADFGLAKSTAPETTVLTVSNITMGTPDFMAPEALHGVAHVDHRADIYALGVMLYQTLTGKLPRGKYDPPSRVVRGLDRRLDRVVDRALQPEPAARYADALEMRNALEPIARSIAKRTAACAGSRDLRKRPLLIALVATVLAAGAALVKFGPWKTPGASGGPRPGTPQASAGEDGKQTGAVSSKSETPATATKAAPFVNTLGQEFVPVPGTDALFCRWDTRVRDFAEYARVNIVDGAWMRQEKEGVLVSRELEYPAVGVSWNDATAFCVWLTTKENLAGRLPGGMRYRLPTDEEWSRAAGLAQEDGATPKAKGGNSGLEFPWGREFPPAKGKLGNYADAAFHGKFPNEKNWIEGYTDDYATTSPVGSFPPNEYGLYDMGGNVWQWCEDLLEPGSTERVLRGSSWNNYDRVGLLLSSRYHGARDYRSLNYGFRCVIGVSAR